MKNYVQNDRIAKQLKVSHGQAVVLNVLASKAADAQVNEHNTGKKASKEIRNFEEYAAKLDFQTQWNGLYPTLIKDTNVYHVDWFDVTEK